MIASEKAIELLYRFSVLSIDHASVDPTKERELSAALAKQGRSIARKLFIAAVGYPADDDELDSICAGIPMPPSSDRPEVTHEVSVSGPLLILHSADGDGMDSFDLCEGRRAAIEQVGRWLASGHKISAANATAACLAINEYFRDNQE